MGSHQWKLDLARNQYYYEDRVKGVYKYSDGTEIPLPRKSDGNQTLDTQSEDDYSASASSFQGNTPESVTLGLFNLSLGETGGQTVHGSTESYPQQPYQHQNVNSPGQPNYHQPFGQSNHLLPSGIPDAYSVGRGFNYPPLLGGQPPPFQTSPYASVPPYSGGFRSSTGYQFHNPSTTAYYYQPTEANTRPSNEEIPQNDGRAPTYPYQPTVSQTKPSNEEILRQVSRRLNPSNEAIVQQHRLEFSLNPHRWFGGTPGDEEKLDPSFRVRYPGYAFFKTGVVFRVLWPELAGDLNQNITIATTPRFKGVNIFCKIRWFVVVREGHDCCTCLSIQTYGGRGVPQNKFKNQHAVMYTGSSEPHAPETDGPMRDGDTGLGQSIRVIGKTPRDIMDPLSRVNFLKIYTVEHNVKVEEFGKVDQNDEWKLITQFNGHWRIVGSAALPSARNAPPMSPTSTQYSSHSRESSIPENTHGSSYGMAPIVESPPLDRQSRPAATPRTRYSEGEDDFATEEANETNPSRHYHRRLSSSFSDTSHRRRTRRPYDQ